MHWSLPIHFQLVRAQHHHFPNRNLVPHHIPVLVFSPFLLERCHEHYRAPFWVCCHFHLPILISHVSVLCKFVELYFLLCIIHVLYVLLNFLLVVHHILLQNEMNKTVAHRCFSQYQLKFSVRVQLYQNLIDRIRRKRVLFLSRVTFVLSNHCRFVDVQFYWRRGSVVLCDWLSLIYV